MNLNSAVNTKKDNVKKPNAVAVNAKPKLKAATAAAILGRPPVTPATKDVRPLLKVKPEWVDYYNTLVDLRERLIAQREGLAKESSQEVQSYSLHMADAGTDNFDRDFALSLLSSDQDAIYEIDEALKRIERKTFGVCELTGKPIPKARLDAIPWTRFTVEAQAQLEREGMLRQRKLGNLGTVDSTVGVEPEEGEAEEAEEKVTKEKE